MGDFLPPMEFMGLSRFGMGFGLMLDVYSGTEAGIKVGGTFRPAVSIGLRDNGGLRAGGTDVGIDHARR